MDASNYFEGVFRESNYLNAHGVGSWPDLEELTRMVFDLQDALDFYVGLNGMRLVKDVRGRWCVEGLPAGQELKGAD